MAVLPESMNHLDSQNMPGSLSSLENYIRYMGERIEFSISGLSKEIGSVRAEKGELLKKINDLESGISSLSARVTALENPATVSETEE